MALHLEALCTDADDPARLAAFWADLLGWRVVTDRTGAHTLVPDDPACVPLRFRATSAPRRGSNRYHLHVTSTSEADMAATVERALALGARHLDLGQTADEGHVVLADPEGDAFCVIPPWSRFLADTGRLGELAGDGGRATGVFWSTALGWPLVWDEGDETAIQSPAGGTKVAWGGEPVTPTSGVSRTRLEISVGPGESVADAVSHLRSLGASPVDDATVGGAAEGAVALADPAGTELLVLPAP